MNILNYKYSIESFNFSFFYLMIFSFIKTKKKKRIESIKFNIILFILNIHKF